MWKKAWKIEAPPPSIFFKVFARKLINNGVPTKTNKFARKIADDNTCEMCGQENEDGYHAVVGYQHARSLRKLLRQY